MRRILPALFTPSVASVASVVRAELQGRSPVAVALGVPVLVRAR